VGRRLRSLPTRRSSDLGLLVLEDLEEEDYRLDRYLTQLRRSGLLDGVTGIALGSWTGCGPEASVREVLLDRLGGLGVPVLGEVGFGHCAPSWTVPLGVPAVPDAGAGTLEFEVPAPRSGELRRRGARARQAPRPRASTPRT